MYYQSTLGAKFLSKFQYPPKSGLHTYKALDADFSQHFYKHYGWLCWESSGEISV